MLYSVKRGLDDNQRSVEVPSDRLRSALGVSGPRFRVFNHKEWWEGVVCTYQRTPSKARTIPFRFHVCIQRGFQFFNHFPIVSHLHPPRCQIVCSPDQICKCRHGWVVFGSESNRAVVFHPYLIANVFESTTHVTFSGLTDALFDRQLFQPSTGDYKSKAIWPGSMIPRLIEWNAVITLYW